jgi:outer membrane immunogenic protein
MRLNFLAIAIAGATAASGAFAADLPARKSPAPAAAPQAWSWTGCYAGVNAGDAWRGNSVFDPQADVGAGGDTSNAFAGGGQIGCDYQAAAWVFGLQSTVDWTALNGHHLYPGSATETLANKTNWFATETARLGYLIAPQWLIYVKGGVAETRFRYTDDDPSVSATSPYWGSASAEQTGWVIGGGGEYAFARNWSLFAEYDYADFGRSNLTFSYVAPNPANATPYAYRETNNLQTVLVGLNFRFDWASPAPIAGRY